MLFPQLTHSGKGGAGNVRSPSRDADGNRKAAKEVDEYARTHHDPNAPVRIPISQSYHYPPLFSLFSPR